MGEIFVEPSFTDALRTGRPWYRELTRYHWFVLAAASLGWIFDCLDQQLFTLARAPAMKELLRNPVTGVVDLGQVNYWGPVTTTVLLIGWATGGIVFGILGDRLGRVKTMILTIVVYSICTGLSAISYSVYDFALYRLLTGFGAGGEFAVGVALVAETMPDRARPFALGALQALSTIGNISAALIGMFFGGLERAGALDNVHLFGHYITAWRGMFLVGALPALLAVVIQRRLKEPERWKMAVGADPRRKAGSLRELFGNPCWRQRAIVGMTLASAGVIGLWGIGFFSPDLNRSVLRKHYVQSLRDGGAAEQDRDFIRLLLANPAKLDNLNDSVEPGDLISPSADNNDAQVLFEIVRQIRRDHRPVNVSSVMLDWEPRQVNASSEDRARVSEFLGGGGPGGQSFEGEVARIVARGKDLDGKLTFWASITSLMFNLGSLFGVITFTRMTQRFGRRPCFAFALVAAMITTALTFTFISQPSDIFWMTPVVGFCQLSLFGGYAIYFPELFPTRLRSTGTSFCYNVGRYLAAAGTFVLGELSTRVFAGTSEPLRWAGVTMCAVFLMGLAVLPFAPETRGQPLPE